MSKIKTLKIRGLHSTKDVDIKFKDNTLILVGENGTGKTTCLHIFFYLVSGQWSSLIKYDFKSISITINSNVHSIHKSDLLLAFAKINNRTLRKLPIRARREIIDVFKEQGGDHVSKKVLNIIERNSIPSELLFSALRQIRMMEA